MNFQFISSIIITLIFIGLSSGLMGQQMSELTVEKQGPDTTLTVKVKGVGCAMDIRSIAENVKKIDGVTDCETLSKGATTSFRITYSAGKVDKSIIHKTIEDTPGCKDPKSRPYEVKQ